MKYILYKTLKLEKGESPLYYQDLLLTIEWSRKRTEILSRDGKRCTKCGSAKHFHFQIAKDGSKSYLSEDGKETALQISLWGKYFANESVPRLIVSDEPTFLQVIIATTFRINCLGNIPTVR